MNASKMKNMVILKDLPSNIVEEAYVILKPNIRLEKIAESKINNSEESSSNYIVKEAEMIINNYFSNLEKTKKIKNLDEDRIVKKYKNLKRLCIGFGILFAINVLTQIKI